MRFRIVLTLFALLLAIPLARATIYAGVTFPSTTIAGTGGSTTCSPVCTSASLTWVIPNISYSGSGNNEAILQWLGIAGATNASCNSGGPKSCLGQFGTQITVSTSGVVSCFAWTELLPVDVGYTVLNTGTYPCGVGDTITATMVCHTNCTPYDAAQQWTITIQNVTRTWTFSNDFNWPLGQIWVYAIAEVGGSYQGCAAAPCQVPTTQPFLFSNFTVNGAAAPITASMIDTARVPNISPIRWIAPSGPFGKAGGGGNNFNVCVSSVSAADAAKCGAATYSGAAVGVGP